MNPIIEHIIGLLTWLVVGSVWLTFIIIVCMFLL